MYLADGRSFFLKILKTLNVPSLVRIIIKRIKIDNRFSNYWWILVDCEPLTTNKIKKRAALSANEKDSIISLILKKLV